LQDIASACGQLVVNEQKDGCSDLADIEDLGGSVRKESSKVRLEKRREKGRVRKVSESELIASKQSVIPHRKDSAEVYWRLGVPVFCAFLVFVVAYRALNRMILI
jgi:hypothetical protein